MYCQSHAGWLINVKFDDFALDPLLFIKDNPPNKIDSEILLVDFLYEGPLFDGSFLANKISS